MRSVNSRIAKHERRKEEFKKYTERTIPPVNRWYVFLIVLVALAIEVSVMAYFFG